MYLCCYRWLCSWDQWLIFLYYSLCIYVATGGCVPGTSDWYFYITHYVFMLLQVAVFLGPVTDILLIMYLCCYRWLCSWDQWLIFLYYSLCIYVATGGCVPGTSDWYFYITHYVFMLLQVAVFLGPVTDISILLIMYLCCYRWLCSWDQLFLYYSLCIYVATGGCVPGTSDWYFYITHYVFICYRWLCLDSYHYVFICYRWLCSWDQWFLYYSCIYVATGGCV